MTDSTKGGASVSELDLWPVYEFRPIVENRHWGTLYRYADGRWIEDDGEYDIAFFGSSMAYFVRLPYHQNILWSWLTCHWRENVSAHPKRNPWHYMLRDGALDWGGSWDRDQHENIKVGELAMRRCASIHRCANGTGPEFNVNNEYMTQGLVRIRDTTEIVRPPDDPECMYCGLDWLVNLKLKAMLAD